MSKLNNPKGTRDFSSVEMMKRKYLLAIIEDNFNKYGYSAIETPAMENLSVLTGKYGEEGDRLIFKILNSGDYLKKIDLTKQSDSKKLTPQISEKALRYDLTVPFARYVVQNRNNITFPFKRYQCQPVWRADRPQRGRFREFVQCDADIIGTDSLFSEIELIQLYDDVFSELKLTDFVIEMNNRKVLSGIAEVIGQKDKLIDITVCLDKLDKIGVEKVKEEMINKGVNKEAIARLEPLFDFDGTNFEKLNLLKNFLKKSEVGIKGVNELEFIVSAVSEIGLRNAKLSININLARGLDYYTGAIFEVKSNEVELGSIGGGGRYDDLTSIFGLKGVSGVGISFGFDRISMVLDELNLFPEESDLSTEIMFVNFGAEESIHSLKLIKKLRNNDVSAELYPSPAKLKKQMQYANSKNVSFVALIGSEEINNQVLTLKNMKEGSQKKVKFDALLNTLKNY